VFRIGRFKEEDADYPPGATARAVVERLQVRTQLLGTVLVNGAHARLDDPLADGDVVTLLPILGGG
jgi:molybdopterin converting factor small subunit